MKALKKISILILTLFISLSLSACDMNDIMNNFMNLISGITTETTTTINFSSQFDLGKVTYGLDHIKVIQKDNQNAVIYNLGDTYFNLGTLTKTTISFNIDGNSCVIHNDLAEDEYQSGTISGNDNELSIVCETGNDLGLGDGKHYSYHLFKYNENSKTGYYLVLENSYYKFHYYFVLGN